MASVTNYAPGARGINLKGGNTLWIDPGATVEYDAGEVVGKLPDFGKASDANSQADAELEMLRARVAEMEAQLAGEPARRRGRPPRSDGDEPESPAS